MLKKLLPLILFISCCKPLGPPHLEEVGRFKRKINQSFMQNYGLSCNGSGGGFVDQINKLDMTYIKNGVYSIEEARYLIVRCMEEMYDSINNDENILPYLKTHPFERNCLVISILFKDGYIENRKPNYPIALAHVLICKDKIFYGIDEEDSGSFPTVYEEPYSEAYKIVYGVDMPCSN